jgi:hypothetical protein
LTARSDVVLAVVLEYGELPEILRVSDMLRDRLACSVVVFFAKPHYRRLAQDTAEVIAHGHRWMDSDGATHDAPANETQQELPVAGEAARAAEPRLNDGALPPAVVTGATFVGFIVAAVLAAGVGIWRGLRAAGGDTVAMLSDTRRYRARAGAIEEIVGRLKPCLVVLAQEPVGSELAFVVRAARRFGIPSLLVPFAMFNLRELAEYAYARKFHHVGGRPFNALLKTLCPRWAVRFRDKVVLRLHGARGLALECAGLVNGNPWHPFSALVTAAACEGRVSRENFVAMGLPPARLHVVGSPVHDRLAAHLKQGRSEFAARYGLTPERPIIVCGWPVNMFAWGGASRGCYSDYESVARAWALALSTIRDKHGVQILVSVHPKTLDGEFQVALAHGLQVVRGDSEALIAHCDVFTTLNGSSLTAWAIACGKPTLLFDCFATGYTEFDAVPGCRMVHRETDFVTELDRLCADPAARRALAEAQQKVAGDWGILDGRANERLAALASALIAGENAGRV